MLQHFMTQPTGNLSSFFMALLLRARGFRCKSASFHLRFKLFSLERDIQMQRNPREEPCMPFMLHPLEITCSTQVAQNNFGLCLLDEKTDTRESFHQLPCQRKPPFSKNNHAPFLAQHLSHMFHRIRRGGVNGHRPLVDHHLFMEPAGTSRDRGGHKQPVLLQNDDKEEPVKPGDMVWDQNGGSLCL